MKSGTRLVGKIKRWSMAKTVPAEHTSPGHVLSMPLKALPSLVSFGIVAVALKYEWNTPQSHYRVCSKRLHYYDETNQSSHCTYIQTFGRSTNAFSQHSNSRIQRQALGQLLSLVITDRIEWDYRTILLTEKKREQKWLKTKAMSRL